MHKYERFIIYPLLIFALFYGMSGSDVIQSNAQQIYDEIITKRLSIINKDGERKVLMTTSKDGNVALIKFEGGIMGTKGSQIYLNNYIDENVIIMGTANKSAGFISKKINIEMKLYIWGLQHQIVMVRGENMV